MAYYTDSSSFLGVSLDDVLNRNSVQSQLSSTTKVAVFETNGETLVKTEGKTVIETDLETLRETDEKTVLGPDGRTVLKKVVKKNRE
jgi:hypothetical protein